MRVALMTSTQITERDQLRRSAHGATLWLTGLPSAGKTTLAFALADWLRADGVDVEVLDGDEVQDAPVRRPRLQPSRP